MSSILDGSAHRIPAKRKDADVTTPRVLPDQQRIRALFPALAGDTIFLENAGGSQVPACVADRMHRYLTETYVQLGAGYGLSQRCTATVEEAHAFARTFVNAGDGHAILGSSTTALLNILADSYGRVLRPGQRIILAETGHEANLGCWKRLERLGVEIAWWRMDRETFASPLADLAALLDERTALVALPHVSNLLGGIVDLRAVADLAHAAGARVVADGVAYAPHRAVDVQAWDVDWYVYSTYKVYGPHMAVLYGKQAALDELVGPNHFFIPDDDLPYKFEPGGANHEGCAGLLGLGEYFNVLTGRDPAAPCDRATVEAAGARMREWEEAPTACLLDYLGGRPDVRVVGPAGAGPDRVGTVSFLHATRASREITAVVDRSEVAVRHGHMYAWHLCDALGLDLEDGVVRVSLVHYNTTAEIERLIEVLDEVL
jgi:cysteine desulfurase family protein (TIGR01976 family)